jgi:hypothetical protein
MPIVNKQAEPITELATGSIPDPEADASPSTGTIFGAAFRQNNLIGSAVTDAWNMGGIANYRDPNYSAWDDIKGTPYEEHWQAFATSNNRRYTEALKGQVDTEQRDRRTLDAGGWTGTLANLSAGVLDPTILIPVGGEAIKGAQGYRMLRTLWQPLFRKPASRLPNSSARYRKVQRTSGSASSFPGYSEAVLLPY